MKKLCYLMAAALLASSCIGVSADAKIRKDGSGELTLAYTVRQDFAALGAFNEKSDLPPIPLTEEDFRGGARMVPGITFVSWKRKAVENDYVYTVKFRFASFEALEMYLRAASGDTFTAAASQNAAAASQGTAAAKTAGAKTAAAAKTAGAKEKRQFMFHLWHNGGGNNYAVKALLPKAFEGYTFNLALTLPAPYTVRYIDSAGNTLPGPLSGTVKSKGKKFTVSVPMSDVLAAGKDAAFILSW